MLLYKDNDDEIMDNSKIEKEEEKYAINERKVLDTCVVEAYKNNMLLMSPLGLIDDYSSSAAVTINITIVIRHEDFYADESKDENIVTL